MKNILGGVAAVMILFAAVPVFAQTDTFDVHALVQELQVQYDALKEQVDAGDMTAEEALAQWQVIMDDAWAQKEAFFDARLERVQSRIEAVAGDDEERAALLEDQLTTLKERRQERAEIHTKLRNGEITLEEAQQLRTELRTQIRAGEGMMRSSDGTGQGAGPGTGMGTPPEGAGMGTPPEGVPGDGTGTPPEDAGGPMGGGARRGGN